MPLKTCISCFRAIQRQSRSIPQFDQLVAAERPLSKVLRKTRKTVPGFTTTRAFTTASNRYAKLPEPNATPSSSIPPVTPERAQGSKFTSPKPPSLKAAAEFKKVTGKATETYTAYGATEFLYKECACQADYTIPRAKDHDTEPPKTEDGEDLGVGTGWWHTELGLKPTFSTWSQVTMLHMYFLSARFRCFSAATSQPWQQHLLDHFFYDAENRMTINHNMHARGIRNKYLKDLFIQWRGLLAAYDEGLAKGDAVLAAAIWRNVFKANEDVDVKGLGQIVSYMRRALKGLDALDDRKVMQAGLEFGNPAAERSIVAMKSKMMDLPFDKAPGADLPAKKQSRK